MGERQNLEKRLDELVSNIVRRRDLINGCITCGCAMIYETSTAGHFIHRSHRCVRWSLVNVNLNVMTASDRTINRFMKLP